MSQTSTGRWGRRVGLGIGSAFLASLFMMAPVAEAQQAAGISGTVRDSSGLALPGATVEAASPALIEKTRAVTTDGEGRYTFVDLRPGTYSVTFSLEGFSKIIRDGIILNSGFVASVNVALSVGALSESITVTGASPVVDTSSVRQQETLSQRELESLPSGSVGLQTLAYITPGFAAVQGGGSADVGGGRDSWSAQGNYNLFHGKTGTRASFDGFRNQYFIGAASGVGYITDQGNIAELQLETAGMGAEAGSGSTSLNAIPKSGGNVFSGGLDLYYSNQAMQGANISDSLKAFGYTQSAKVQRIYRMGGQFGGPIAKDRVWFFAAVGRWGQRVNQPNAYFNALQGKANIPAGAQPLGFKTGPTPTIAYAPDTSRPAAGFDWYRNHALRTTWQANSKNRFSFYGDIQKSCRCTTGPFNGANAIEAERGWDWYPSGVIQGTWTSPLTSRLLLEAGGSWQVANWVNFPETGVGSNDRSILELSTGFRYGAAAALTAPTARTGRSAQRFSVSYVTGSHNVKVGISDEQAFNDESRTNNNQVDGLNYLFLGGKPNQLAYFAGPFFQQERQNHEIGLYAQDAWKIHRLTVNLGIRWDYLTMGFPEADLPAGQWVPARHVGKVSGVPEWSDINPRLGVSYDVFGNGRTAVKFSVGRFNQLSRSDMTRRFHPFTSSISNASRNWSDANNDFIPDCNLSDFTANGECGPISNVNFGKFIPTATVFDSSVIADNRDFLWDINTEFAHEIIHGLSVNFSYHHNWDGNFVITDNLLVGPKDYDEYCVTVPTDSRLLNSGKQQCGFYDIKPALFGQGQLKVTNSKGFGNQQRYWDGIAVGMNGRLPKNITAGGGIDSGHQVDDHCYTVDVPNQPNDINNNAFNGGPFCRVETAWMDTLDFRLHASVPIKGGFNASAIFRNTQGAVRNATLTVTSAQVQFKDPTRTALTTTKSVFLQAPNAVFGPRFNQLDVAINKTFNLGWGRLRTALDVYNALNSSSVQIVRTAYTPAGAAPTTSWLRPTAFLDARLARVTASIQF